MRRLLGYLKQHHLAFIALMIALGGTSYAALGPHTIGHRQLKPNSINSKNVRNGSLRAKDFANGQLPPGANGANGSNGLNGATGPTGAKGNYGATGPTGTAGTGTTASLIPIPQGPAPMLYRDQVFDSSTKTADVQYGPADDPDAASHKLDIYQPSGSTSTDRPLYLLIHGGGFVGGDKADDGELADSYARTGYVTASMNYRMDPNTAGCSTAGPLCQAGAVAATNDAQMAVTFLKEHAADYGIDPARVIVGGNSAGAVTSLLVAANLDDPNTPGPPDPDSRVRGAISRAGGMPGAIGDSVFTQTTAPILFFHGTEDATVPIAWPIANQKTLLSKGVYSVLESFPGLGHGNLGNVGSQTRSQTLAFMYQVLGLGQ